jgi:hypothetical protein
VEASAQPAAYRRPAEPIQPNAATRLINGFVEPVRSVLEEAGRIASFGASAFIEIRGVWRYTAETLRQVGILLTGSALVLLGMQFTFGLTCGNEAVYVLRGYGASSYEGVLSALCPLREATPFMFAYMDRLRLRGRDRVDADQRRDRRAGDTRYQLDPLPGYHAAGREHPDLGPDLHHRPGHLLPG